LAIFHRPAIGELINTLIAIASLLGVYVLIKFTNNSLIYIGAVISGSSVIILCFANIWFFKNDFHEIAPSLRFFDLSKLKSLASQGLQFFLIQISALVLFSTDNLIITKLFSPEDVVPYSIAFKIFSIAMIGFGILLTPYWAVYNEAYAKNNIAWIKQTNKKIISLWLITVSGILLMLVFSDYVYKYWIGNTIEIPFMQSLLMAIFVSVHTFNSIFVTFIFAAGKIRVQIYLALIAALANIPLSIFFAKYLDMGPPGVIFSTVLCTLPNIIFGPLQYLRIVNKSDRGIWGK
jgi:O-antigen/teichoic acid export membrane protein